MFEEATLDEKVEMTEENEVINSNQTPTIASIAFTKFTKMKSEIEECIKKHYAGTSATLASLKASEKGPIECTFKLYGRSSKQVCLVSFKNKEVPLREINSTAEEIASGICVVCDRTMKSAMTSASKSLDYEKAKQEELKKCRMRTALRQLFDKILPYLNSKNDSIAFDKNGNMSINGSDTVENIFDYMCEKYFADEMPLSEVEMLISSESKVKSTASDVYKAYVTYIKKKKKVKFTTFNDKDVSDKFRKVYNTYKRESEICNRLLLNSPNKKASPTITSWCVIDNLNEIVVESDLCKAVIKKDKLKSFEIKESIRCFLDTIGSSKYKNASEYIVQLLTEFPYKIQYDSGRGLLSESGTVEVSVKDSKYFVGIQAKLCCKYAEGGSWKNDFKKHLKEVECQMDLAVEKKREEENRKFATFQGSVLPGEIVAIVSANGYITEKNVINALRGTSTSFDVESRNSSNLGAFNDVSEDFISNMIWRMCKAGILYTVRIDGTYCKYDALKTRFSNIDSFLVGDKKNMSTIKKMIKDGTVLNYYDAAQYFNYIGDKELSVQDYISLLHLAKTVEFICLHRHTYINIFKTAPKEFKQFVKMIRDNEDNRRLRKLYKEIIAPIGK